MKQLSLLFTLLLCTILLTSCDAIEQKQQKELSDEFSLFLQNYYETVDTEYGPVLSSENLILKQRYAHVYMEKVEYGTYHICVSMGNSVLNPKGQIVSVPAETLKEEMKYFAEAFIDFAKEKEFDNDYYLYVEISDRSITAVYDYETNTLYLPKQYDKYCEMYSLFGTTDDDEAAGTDEGIQWLVENGFGKIKHREYESYYDFDIPSVGIFDGKFSARNLYWAH